MDCLCIFALLDPAGLAGPDLSAAGQTFAGTAAK